MKVFDLRFLGENLIKFEQFWDILYQIEARLLRKVDSVVEVSQKKHEIVILYRIFLRIIGNLTSEKHFMWMPIIFCPLSTKFFCPACK